MIKLCDEKKCTQCMACVQRCSQSCISMIDSDAGFKKPLIDYSQCIECRACIKSCHILSPIEQIPAKKNVYAAWTKSDIIRKQSSSGGVFSVLAEYIINNGGWVYGAIYSSGLKLIHKGVNSLSDLELLRGSKYIQSDITGIYSEIKEKLKSDVLVLFVGTPCQVAGLYSFLHKEYKNLFTCDLICHGVPSQLSFDMYVKNVIPEDMMKLKSFNFRYTKGWGFELSYELFNRKITLPIKKSYYLTAFNRGYMFMESCYSCKYAACDRIADVTLGDFWDIGQYVRFPYKKKGGISLLKINSIKGEDLFSSVKNKLFIVERSLDEAIKGNYNLANPSVRPYERDSYFKDSMILSSEELIRKYKMYPSYRDYLRIIKRFLQNCF